jgi:alkane 1-monooxygenase
MAFRRPGKGLGRLPGAFPGLSGWLSEGMRRPIPVLIFAALAASPLLPIGLAAMFGGAWALAALVWMSFAAVALDLALPLTAPDAKEGQDFPGSEALLATLGLAALALPVLVVACLGHRGVDGAAAATVLAGGLWLGQVGHPAAHELIHRPGRAARALGVAIYTALMFGHHASSHRLVHHVHVATPADPNSARAGEGFWRFALRAWIGSWRAGRAAEARRGSRAYGIYALGGAAALILAWVTGGAIGLAVWLALALHAQVQILLADYVQHYGLRRTVIEGRVQPVGPAHAWNSGHWASSAQMLNATRHSDHHLHPMRAYPALRLSDDAPRLPWPLPVAAVVAMIPPLWHRRMRPRLPSAEL